MQLVNKNELTAKELTDKGYITEFNEGTEQNLQMLAHELELDGNPLFTNEEFAKIEKTYLRNINIKNPMLIVIPRHKVTESMVQGIRDLDDFPQILKWWLIGMVTKHTYYI